MPLPEQADNIPRLINYYREQAHDIPPQHTDIERLDFSNRPILTTENDCIACLAVKLNLGLNQNRLDYSTYSADLIWDST